MVLIPSLVLYNNKLDFSQNPRAGIVSLLTQLGYTSAQDLIDTLGNIFDHRSVYAFIDLYRVIGTDGIAISSVLFNTCLGGIPLTNNLTNLKSRIPRFTTGALYIEGQLSSSNMTNYASLLTWLGYPYIDISQFITNPLLYSEWVSNQEPILIPLNQALLGGQLVSFFQQLILLLLGIDITQYTNLWRTMVQWIHIGFVRYAFGSSVQQSEWFN